MTTSYFMRHVTDMYIPLVYRNNALEKANWGSHLIFSDLFSWNIVENIYEISKQAKVRPETPKSALRPFNLPVVNVKKQISPRNTAEFHRENRIFAAKKINWLNV